MIAEQRKLFFSFSFLCVQQRLESSRQHTNVQSELGSHPTSFS